MNTNDQTIELLARAAEHIDDNAEALRQCHTIDGHWCDDIEDQIAKAQFNEEKTLAAELYAEAKRLGGPLQ